MDIVFIGKPQITLPRTAMGNKVHDSLRPLNRRLLPGKSL
jgi:hypothetical protein